MTITRSSDGELGGQPDAPNFVHVVLYFVILLMSVTGFVAWYWQVGLMNELRSLDEDVILVIVGLHVVVALYQHIVARTDVLVRMLPF